MRLLRAVGALEQETVRRHGLSLASYEVLVEIAGEPVRSPLALARTLAAERSSIEYALRELVAAGYVSPQLDLTDGHGRLTDVTPAGLAVVQAVIADLQRVEDDLLGGVDSGDREVFFNVLQQVASGGPLRDLPQTSLHPNRPRPIARAKRFLTRAKERTHPIA